MKLKLCLSVLSVFLLISVRAYAQNDKGKLLFKAHVNDASWSPDGNTIAVSITGDGSDQFVSGIYIISPDGKVISKITSGINPTEPMGSVGWTEDGKSVEFLTGHFGENRKQFIASDDGKDVQEIVTRDGFADSLYFDWLPDGRTAIRIAEDKWNIVAVNLDGSVIRRFDERLSPNGVAPNLSHVTGLIAAATEKDIVIIDAATFEVVDRFYESNAQATNSLGWSPDGNLLVVLTYLPNVQPPAWTILDRKGNQLSSTNIGKDFQTLWWSPDSNKLAVSYYLHQNSGYKVLFYTIEGELLGEIETTSMDDSWTPDSLYRTITPEGKIADVELNGKVVRLYDFPSTATTTWSPNGKLMTVSNPCCSSNVLIYDLGAKLHYSFQHNSQNTGNIKWSPDSKSILVVEEGKSVWLYKLP